MDLELNKHLENKARDVRLKVLDMAVRARSGHVTTAFSQTDVLVSLYYGRILRFEFTDPGWPERDRFILSKGQGGIGLYPILADLGFFSTAELDRFCTEGGILGVHAENMIPGVEVLTGSLGHGLPLGVGMAHAIRLDEKSPLVIVMTGDGELYEGSNWEAMFAAGARFNRHSLSGEYGRLIVIVDRNNQSTIGKHDKYEGLERSRVVRGSMPFAADGPGLEPLEDKFRAFNFEVIQINGHDFDQIFEAFQTVRQRPSVGKPLCVIAHTEKGHGSMTLSDKRGYHYVVPKGEELERVRRELEK